MTRTMYAIYTALFVAGLVIGASAPPAFASPRIEVGVLNCTVSGGTGFIVGSTKSLDCTFKRPGQNETYQGTIKKFGVDIGTTSKSYISWAVFAPTKDVPPGALSGSYGGLTAEATAGVGLGANALIGGSSESLALQPLSVQAQQGLNVAVGIASLELSLK